MHPMAVLNQIQLDGLAATTTRSALPDAAVMPTSARPHRLARTVARMRGLVARRRPRRRSPAPRVRPLVPFTGLNVRNHGRIGACPE